MDYRLVGQRTGLLSSFLQRPESLGFRVKNTDSAIRSTDPHFAVFPLQDAHDKIPGQRKRITDTMRIGFESLGFWIQHAQTAVRADPDIIFPVPANAHDFAVGQSRGVFRIESVIFECTFFRYF